MLSLPIYPSIKGLRILTQKVPHDHWYGLATHESKCWQKLTDREVNESTLGNAVLAFLKWSKTAITFDRKDHSNHIP